MKLKNSEKLLLLIVFACIELCKSIPTFGDEFVHIKVHVPKETHIVHTSEHVVSGHSHIPPVPAHKVIHHYHHHRPRRPHKKGLQSNKPKHNNLIESLILSELKSPISGEHLELLNHAGDIAEHLVEPPVQHETYIVEEEEPEHKKKVETYAIIEEGHAKHSHHYPKKPKVETYKVIETKIPKHEESHTDDFLHPTVETIKLIDTKPTHHIHEDSDYHYHHPRTHTKTVEVLDSHYGSDYHHSHHSDDINEDYHYKYKKSPYVDSVKIIETKRPLSNSHDHKVPRYEIEYSTHLETPKKHIYEGQTYTKATKLGYAYQPQHNYDNDYDNRPQVASIEITKTKGNYQDDDYRNYKYSTSSSSESSGGYHYRKPVESALESYDHTDSYSQHLQPPPLTNHASYKPSQEVDYTPHTDLYSYPHKRPSVSNNYYEEYRPASHEDEVHAPLSLHNPHASYLPDPPSQPNRGTIIDWPKRVQSAAVAETYSGVDSYSVGHVQGIDGGGYSYPPPYP